MAVCRKRYEVKNREKDIMSKIDVGVIVAMDIELENIEKAMTDVTISTVCGMKFVLGTLHGKSVAAARCGIGKVFAAICTQTMILSFEPAVIINAGVAGALSKDLTIGEIVIAKDAVQHDMDTTGLGDEPGLISGLDIVKIPTDEKVTAVLESVVRGLGIKYEVGTIATGDIFVNTKEKKRSIVELFGASACEMEGASVVQTCYVNKVPCSILRAISDGGDDNSNMDYQTFAKMAAATSARVIEEFVRAWE